MSTNLKNQTFTEDDLRQMIKVMQKHVGKEIEDREEFEFDELWENACDKEYWVEEDFYPEKSLVTLFFIFAGNGEEPTFCVGDIHVEYEKNQSTLIVKSIGANCSSTTLN
ncbi:hypothetical protein [Metabacillus iocasae]|uniref:Nucleoid-associated protein YejK n=1 Tax=Priestia iocasae TaxID=2291674 RepID=A0ABS2QUL5_9BACI|nr:hypothetical protein [Metabacillus iocasae]MBM7703179.1 nucleoid-associated protein YejK [Metabacillus iocasae]